jgi:hypothetical protein
MGWLFSTQWRTKAELINGCAELSQGAKDKGWELLHAKTCNGGFALAYKNNKTGEMIISYHLAAYKRNEGWGEKEIDPSAAWGVLPEEIVTEYMGKYGDRDYFGKTNRERFEEIKAEQKRKKEQAKTELIKGKFYCTDRFGYSSMPLGIGQFNGMNGRSLVFGNYRMAGLKKSNIISCGFDTRTDAELWAVKNKIVNMADSYYYDDIKTHINDRIKSARFATEQPLTCVTQEHIKKRKEELAHCLNLLSILERGAA